MLIKRIGLLLVVASFAACGSQGSGGADPGASAGTGSGTGAGTTTGTGTGTPTPTGPVTPADGHHRRCGWIFTNDPNAVSTFVANAAWFDAIHPDWYALQSDSISVRPLSGVDDPQTLAAARANKVQVWPMVASVENVDWTRNMMGNPSTRSAHIAQLVQLAQSHNYDGLDLDYEHLWDKSDAQPLAAFMTELGKAMHAAGKKVSMTAPALDGPSSVWSYATMAASLDEAHMMGYDYHTIGTHAGPTAPLGWIDAAAAQAQATGHPDHFVLGLPNYGVTPTKSCVLASCASSCTSPLLTATDHMNNCSFGNWAAGRSLNCFTSSNEQLFFDDAQSLAEKAQAAKAHGLAGICYWNVGGEPPGFFAALRAVF
jgi:spore germination protein YaaH